MQNNENRMNEYMRAIALRSMRFLPSLDAQDWETVVEFSTTSESVVERLMATETWLYLKHESHDFIKDRHLEAIVKELQKDPPPPSRLKANYILILGLHEQEEAIEALSSDRNDDYLLREAINMAFEGSVTDLFEYQEPKIIREKYYSGKRSNTEGEDDYQ